MSAPPSPTLSDSALLDSLEDDPRFDLSAQRERRLEELQQEVRRVQTLQTSEYGRVITYGEEKKLIERMAKETYCLIHFFHPDFQRCRILDTKLDEIAPKYTHTLFLRTSVASSPFLVAKFGVQILPHVLIFVHGRCADRLIGFEDLGHNDQFTTKELEARLRQSGALPTGDITLANTLRSDLVSGLGDDREEDGADEADGKGERRKGGTRKGKTGIRNGLASSQRDVDEWD